MSLAGVQYTLSALSMDGSAVLAAIFWLVPCGPCGRRDCSAYGGSLGCLKLAAAWAALGLVGGRDALVRFLC